MLALALALNFLVHVQATLKTYDEIRLERKAEIPAHISQIVESVYSNLTKEDSQSESGLITNLRYVDPNDMKEATGSNGGSQQSYQMNRQAQMNMKAYGELLRYDGEYDLTPYLEDLKIPDRYCPKMNIKCDRYEHYRRIDGSCNNLQYTWWGKAGSPYTRILKAEYDDGVNLPRTVGRDGYSLVNSRRIAIDLIPAFDTKSKWTNMFFAIGQVIAHDTSKFAVVTNADGSPKQCPCESADPDCISIPTPKNDYMNLDQQCMSMARSAIKTKDFECSLGHREQTNLVTHHLDCSFLYGSDIKTANDLRTFKYGELKVSFTPYSDLEQLPKLNGTKCPYTDKRRDKCFKAGDTRAEDNLPLLSQHALWLRVHNNIARKLYKLNPKWSDELIYQEARRIVIALYQHIIINEFLPVFLGDILIKKFDIFPIDEGYSMRYDMKRNPSTINEFAHAAFRIAHTMVNDEHLLADEYLKAYEKRDIGELQLNSILFAIKSPLENVMYGSIVKESYEKHCQMNKPMNHELFDGIFNNPHTHRWSLPARNTKRGRDHGFPGYNRYRAKCGLNRAETFEDLRDNIPDFLIEKLKKLYRHVDDIDLFIGLISERPLKGAVAGFTSGCIIAKQFSDYIHGDRFWYDNGHDKTTRFTMTQLYEIKKITMARIVCDNSNVKYIQQFPFLMPNEKYNPFIDCTEIPRMSLQPWEDQSHENYERHDDLDDQDEEEEDKDGLFSYRG